MALPDPIVLQTVNYSRRDFGDYASATAGTLTISNKNWSASGPADMMIKREITGVANAAGITPKHVVYVVVRTNDRAALTNPTIAGAVADINALFAAHIDRLANKES